MGWVLVKLGFMLGSSSSDFSFPFCSFGWVIAILVPVWLSRWDYDTWESGHDSHAIFETV